MRRARRSPARPATPSAELTARTLPLSKPQIDEIARDHRASTVPRSESDGTSCSASHSSWPSVGERPRSLPSTERTATTLSEIAGAGDHGAVDQHRPQRLAVGGVQRDHVAVGRAHDHQVPADRRAAAERQLGVGTPQPAAGPRDRRPPPRRLWPEANTRLPSTARPSPRRSCLARLRSATEALQMCCTRRRRLDRAELRRLVRVLVLGAGGQQSTAPPPARPSSAAIAGCWFAR